MMSAVLRVGPYRFFFYAGDGDEPFYAGDGDEPFYAGDGDEPPHVHVERDESEAKIWLDPIRLDRSGGFSGKELRQVEQMTIEYLQQLMDSWHAFFNG